MGRKVNQEVEETEQPETSEAEPSAPMLEGGALGVTDTKKLDGEQPQTKVFEPPKRNAFRVGGYQPMRINTPYGITHLHPGQVVDDQNYDIEKLKQLGIPLTAVVEPKPVDAAK